MKRIFGIFMVLLIALSGFASAAPQGITPSVNGGAKDAKIISASEYLYENDDEKEWSLFTSRMDRIIDNAGAVIEILGRDGYDVGNLENIKSEMQRLRESVYRDMPKSEKEKVQELFQEQIDTFKEEAYNLVPREEIGPLRYRFRTRDRMLRIEYTASQYIDKLSENYDVSKLEEIDGKMKAIINEVTHRDTRQGVQDLLVDFIEQIRAFKNEVYEMIGERIGLRQ